MTRIVVLDGHAINPGDLSWKPFEDFGEVLVYDRTPWEQIAGRLYDVEIAFTNKALFSRELFEKLPKLTYLGVLATGYNLIDVAAAHEMGITVTNIPEYASYATAQMTLALLLEMTNRTARHDLLVHEGSWTKCPDFCFWESNLTELWNKTIGIVGYGKIGRRVAIIARSLGMKVLVTSRTIEADLASGSITSTASENDGIILTTLQNLLSQSDVISIHCPLTPDTKNLICRDTISHMKEGVLLINTSRGPILNERDVAEALENGKISGVAVDVLSSEPPTEDNPLLRAPNCIITPHIAWAPRETRQRLLDTAYENLKSFLSGISKNVVS
jgi:glycerate dehydrogenase